MPAVVVNGGQLQCPTAHGGTAPVVATGLLRVAGAAVLIDGGESSPDVRRMHLPGEQRRIAVHVP